MDSHAQSAGTFRWRRPVLKFGTSTLTGGTEALSMARLAGLVEQVATLHAAGLQPVVVSSGAVAAGRHRLQSPPGRRDLAMKQMLAAVGQSRLMHLYDQAFEFHGITTAQVLLTRHDLAERGGYLNVRTTLLGLCDRRVVPIVNENDVVASDELRLGDNDTLSALVASLIDADLLVLVTDIPGLYTADPSSDAGATLVRDVPAITAEIEGYAGGSGTGLGTGGMWTKIQAAKLATASGAETRIVDGRESDVVVRLLRGEEIGTRFRAATDALEGRKRWILSGLAHAGRLDVDAGAARALRERHASLLSAGVVAVHGAFQRGDTLDIAAPNGVVVARGIANYGSDDLRMLVGRRSGEIEASLGYSYGSHVVHRNDMVLLAGVASATDRRD
jgi:glutamate 5-kinase